MAENGRKRNEASLIVALACGAGVREAAEQSGMAERTVYRRLRDIEFVREVESARGAMLGNAVGRLASNARRAADALAELLSSGSESIRLSAARAILDLAPRLREAVDLELRLEELERRLAATSGEQSEPGYQRLVGPR